MDELHTYRVAGYDDFVAALAKLNKRATRLGVTGVSHTVVDTETEYHVKWNAGVGGDGNGVWTTNPDGVKERGTLTGLVRTIRIVTVTGDAPKLAGWTFVATIQDGGEAGNVLRTVPNATCPERYRTSAPYACDHCGLDRRRRETFVVVNDDGRDAQVGRTCLRDFLGHKSPEAIATWAEFLANFDPNAFYSDSDEGGGGGGGYGAHSGYSRKYLVRIAVAAIEKYGWLPRSKRDFGQPTADVVLDIIDPPRHKKKDEFWPSVLITDEHKEKALKVIEWAEALAERDDLGDYLWNLRVAMASDVVDRRSVGLAVSAVTAYEREVEKLNRAALAAAARAAQPASEYIGEIGGKVTLTLTLVRTLNVESRYGVTELHKMVDADGNSFSWFCSGTSPWDGSGDISAKTITATVKDHREYQGRKETMLTRVRLATGSAS